MDLITIISHLKLAVTLRAVVIETVERMFDTDWHPLQLLNFRPAFGVTINIALVPDARGAEQVAPHAMPAGTLETGSYCPFRYETLCV